jgi:hypothetical protein
MAHILAPHTARYQAAGSTRVAPAFNASFVASAVRPDQPLRKGDRYVHCTPSERTWCVAPLPLTLSPALASDVGRARPGRHHASPGAGVAYSDPTVGSPGGMSSFLVTTSPEVWMGFSTHGGTGEETEQ